MHKWYNVLMRRVIFHVDVNSAFLSWEACYRLHTLGESEDLRLIPSAVGGDVSKRHGIILAKSIPCKAYGVQTGEPVVSALKKCPHLKLVEPHYDLYSRSSRAVMEMMSEYTDVVEQYSVDEAFMDMTGCLGKRKPVDVANELRKRIREELGFTVNIGISENKLLAKMASDFEKPDKTHTLWPEEIEKKMWPLPVGDLFFIGRSSQVKLASLGVSTIGELAHLDPEILYAHFKSHGYTMHNFANGIDDSAFEIEEGPNKGYGNSLTTPYDVTTEEIAFQYLLELSETVAARLREDGVKISTVTVSVRTSELVFYNHQMQLLNPTDLTSEIYEAACNCFHEMWDGEPLRQLGVRTTKVEEDTSRQLSLFGDVDYEKHKAAETAVDELRVRFGSDIITRASLMGKKVRWEREED